MSYKIIPSLVDPIRCIIILKRNLWTTRIILGTHYDTLELPKNCTAKEVRDSFIKLSKKCHPDRNRDDPNTHAQFVKLNEAYSVLSRPEKRRVYDFTLKSATTGKYHRTHENSPFDVYTTANQQRVYRDWREESFWKYKDKSSYNDNNRSDNFYGIKGIKRLPNGLIALLTVLVAGLGVWLQVLLIRHSTTFNRQVLDERSQESSRVLADVHEQALRHGNKAQIELLRQRLEKLETEPDSSKANSTKDKPNSEIHTRNANSSPQDTYDSFVIILPEGENKKPMERFKRGLGYLGEMPSNLENTNLETVPEENTLKPVLLNNSNIISRLNEDSRTESDCPSPVLCNTSKNIERKTSKNEDLKYLTGTQEIEKITHNLKMDSKITGLEQNRTISEEKSRLSPYQDQNSKSVKYNAQLWPQVPGSDTPWEGSNRHDFDKIEHNLYTGKPKGYMETMQTDRMEPILATSAIVLTNSEVPVFIENLTSTTKR